MERVQPPTRSWPSWLAEGEMPATTSGEALSFFDGLAPLTVEGLLGRWAGRQIATGHPMDGLLGGLGWYGKELIDAETVHPLLFGRRGAAIHAVNPAFMPMGLVVRHPGFFRRAPVRSLFAALRPLAWTSRPRARLRLVQHRGIVSAAMIYDALPIVDHFRAVDSLTVMGLMDLRGMTEPLFFLLTRDE